MSEFYHGQECFLLSYDKEYILYIPLIRLVLLLNSSGANIVRNIMQSRELEDTEDVREFVDSLADLGILNYIGGEIPENPFSISEEDFACQEEYLPTEVTLFLTHDCQLACQYCYADSGKFHREMPFEVAKDAMDFVAENCLKQNQDSLVIGFHGGGEPTYSWNLFAKSVKYATNIAKDKKLYPVLAAATNGILGEEQIEFIAQYLKGVNVSIDGPPDICDRQRPFRKRRLDGKTTSEILQNTLKKFDELEFPYGLRATITSESTNRMPEIVEFFLKNFHPETIHLEPLFSIGRAKDISPPDPKEFTKYFIEAKEIGQKHGVEVSFSGARLYSLHYTFCGALGSNLCVTPEGILSTCYEVLHPEDARSKHFWIGYSPLDVCQNMQKEIEVDASFFGHLRKIDRFYIDFDRLADLRKRTVSRLKKCTNCFAKWHCAGDCPAKTLSLGDFYNNVKNPRCSITKGLLKNQMIEALSQEGFAYLPEKTKQILHRG